MDINPEDIESMSVLKGSAASALYGSCQRCEFSLPKVREGVVEVNFQFKTLSWAKALPQFQNQYVMGLRRAEYDSSKKYIGTVFPTTTPTTWGKQGATFYDNMGTFFDNGLILDESISVSGGTKQGSYYLSGSLFDQNGYRTYNRLWQIYLAFQR